MEPAPNRPYSAGVIHGPYHPHIDGIRALAVLPVVLFHALPALCPGGFVGVDVFFVISGYLITGGILRDLDRGQFTIRSFYHRRIRRILPAYFTLIACVFAVGCTIYYSVPLVQLADASAMGTLFSANLYFWKIAESYFAPEIHSNALLHLWSLSVEEQFYLFIPLLTALIWKFNRRTLLPAFAAIALVSFALSVRAVAIGGQNDAFYLLHLRAWELLSGSLLAMLPPPSIVGREGHLRRHSVAATWALALVVVPYFALSSQTPFPGAAALPSIVGTAILIRYGETKWVSGLLSSSALVGTGKISYSLYLWHWPVMVFWKYVVYEQLRVYDYAGMILLSFLMSFLSWKFVELPARTSERWTVRRSFVLAAGGIGLLVAVSFACERSKGWRTWLHPRANAIVVNQNHYEFLRPLVKDNLERLKRLLSTHSLEAPSSPGLRNGPGNYLGVPGHPDVLLVGDSHAGSLQHGLDLTLREAGRGAMFDVRAAEMMFVEQAPASQNVLAALQAQPTLSKLMLVQYWSHHLGRNPLMFSQLEAFASRVRQTGRTLYIVTDVPFHDSSTSNIAAKREIIGLRRIDVPWDGRQTDSEYNRRQGEINRRLATICAKAGAVLIPLHLAFKNGDHFIALDTAQGKIVPMYRDKHHLSREGSIRAARFLMSYIYPEPQSSHP